MKNSERKQENNFIYIERETREREKERGETRERVCAQNGLKLHSKITHNWASLFTISIKNCIGEFS